MTSKMLMWLRTAHNRDTSEKATMLIRGTRPGTFQDQISSRMATAAHTPETHGARSRTVSARASARAAWGRKARMTYSGMARHKAAKKAQAAPRIRVCDVVHC